jgi:hypothetical protein
MEAALMTSGQPVRRGSIAHDHAVYAMLADVAAQQRDAAALRQYAPRTEELAVRDEHPLYLAIAQRAWGVARRLAGEYDEAQAQLDHALEAFQRMGMRWQEGRTLVELGELAQARPDGEPARAAARNYYAQALATFEELRAAPAAAQVREVLGQSSVVSRQ